MNLLLDIGNTRIKWALADKDQWLAGEPLLRADHSFEDIADAAWKDMKAPQRVIISNVATDAYAKSVQEWSKQRWNINAELLIPVTECCGVTNAYQRPEQLGADRWAGLIAARSLYNAAVIVIDCGSAITIDALARDGRHLGGLIVPGIDIMISALTQNTSGVMFENSGEQQHTSLGCDTTSAVHSGVHNAVVSFLNCMSVGIFRESDEPAVNVITGGDAERLLPFLTTMPDFEPHLVLKGLAIVARETVCAT